MWKDKSVLGSKGRQEEACKTENGKLVKWLKVSDWFESMGERRGKTGKGWKWGRIRVCLKVWKGRRVRVEKWKKGEKKNREKR